LGLDGVLALLLGADEQYRAAPLRHVADIVVGVLQQLDRLLEIDDVDAPALAEDEPAHLGVPSPRLMAEVHAGLEQLSHGDCGHAQSSWSRLNDVPTGGDIRNPGLHQGTAGRRWPTGSREERTGRSLVDGDFE